MESIKPNYKSRTHLKVINIWSKKGVYVIRNPDKKLIEMTKDTVVKEELISELESALSDTYEIFGLKTSKRSNIGFARRGTYKLEFCNPESIPTDSFMILTFGEEKAKKISELARTSKEDPFIYGFNYSDENIIVASTTTIDMPFVGHGIKINGNDYIRDYF